MIFVDEHFFEEREFWHWKYRYAFTKEAYGDQQIQDEIYDWCLFNLNNLGGWHIRDNGVIIFHEEDAMAFKLRWL